MTPITPEQRFERMKREGDGEMSRLQASLIEAIWDKRWTEVGDICDLIGELADRIKMDGYAIQRS